MQLPTEEPPVGPVLRKRASTAFGCPRDDLDQRFVYTVISPRARGLSIGINMNPDKICDFDCVYCEVDRSREPLDHALDVPAMSVELENVLSIIHSGAIKQRPCYKNLPPELLELRHVALSGDGEPTLCPNFVDAIQAIVHTRALHRFPFFKMVLITNASGLDRPDVAEGLQYFTDRDEIWAKLEAGTQNYMDRVNRSKVPLQKVLDNILLCSQRRPVIIQSLFPSIEEKQLPAAEIEEFAHRLKELKEAGAQIPLVQIYSATRPTCHWECGHLPLRALSHIAQTVRSIAGLRAEIF
jgi:wyosine [tRNA(Phe)-imidazoG37] synthetase (radical SAM superfamily)